MLTLRPMLENSEAYGSTGTGQLMRLTLGTSSSFRFRRSWSISEYVTPSLEIKCAM